MHVDPISSLTYLVSHEHPPCTHSMTCKIPNRLVIIYERVSDDSSVIDSAFLFCRSNHVTAVDTVFRLYWAKYFYSIECNSLLL